MMSDMSSLECALTQADNLLETARMQYGQASAARLDDEKPTGSHVRAWTAVRAAGGHEVPCGDRAFVLQLNSGRTAFITIDIASHGTSRAPLSSALAQMIATSLRCDGSPAAALGCADEWLRTVDDEYPYAVAFVAIVNPIAWTVVYASAGHECAFTLGDDGRIAQLMPTAPMLGILLTFNPCDAVFCLNPAQTLVVATDGVAESRPAGSVDFFGAEGAAREVARSLRTGADPAHGALEAACIHAGGCQVDDAGILIVQLGSARRVQEAYAYSTVPREWRFTLDSLR